MSVNSRLEHLERAFGSAEHGVNGAAVRAAVLELLAKPHAVESLRSAALAEDCNLSLDSQIVEWQANVDRKPDSTTGDARTARG